MKGPLHAGAGPPILGTVGDLYSPPILGTVGDQLMAHERVPRRRSHRDVCAALPDETDGCADDPGGCPAYITDAHYASMAHIVDIHA